MIVNKNVNYVFYVIMEIFLVISILSLCGIASYNHSSLNSNGISVSDIVNNWSKGPIVDIISIDKLADCSTGYELLVRDQWSGTVDGCDCRGQTSLGISIDRRNKLNRVIFSNNETRAGSLNVNPRSARTYGAWKGSKICVQRSNSTYDEIIPKMAVSNICTLGYKKCGVVDTVNNIYCVPFNASCPINKVMISNIRVNPPFDAIYKKINLGSNYALYFTSYAPNSSLIVDVGIAEDGNICVDPTQKYSKNATYILEVDQGITGNCSYYLPNAGNFDRRYKAIDTTSKQDLYGDNGVSWQLNFVPDYPYALLLSNVGLVSRPYIGFSQTCKNFDQDVIEDINTKVSKLWKFKALV